MATQIQQQALVPTIEVRFERRWAAEANRQRLRQIILPIVAAIPVLGLWQAYATALANPLVPTPLRIAAAFPTVVADPAVWAGLASSDLSLLLGFVAAVGVGVPLGLLSGRSKLVDGIVGPLLDLALVTPMIVLMPVVLVALGLTREAQVVMIFIFSITVVVLPIRAGLKTISDELVDMASSFGASELELWREVLLPGAIPSIATGLRMGFGQANLGMAAVELVMLAIGIGNVLLDLQSTFHRAEEFAVIGIIVIQSTVAMLALRALERQMSKSRSGMVELEPSVR